jgi:hypothetical protein
MARAAAFRGIGTAVMRWLFACLVAVAMLFPPVTGFVREAQAQEVKERRSIIDLLFRGRPRVVKNKSPAVTKVRRKKPKVSQQPRNSAVEVIEPDVAKLPDAKKVLVIGDFMAAALADGLTMATAADTQIVIEKGTDGSSGLVRSDHLDWPVTLKARIDTARPALIVIMLGSNDRQQMTVAGEKQKFRSELWNAEYERRIDAVLKVATEAKIPFIWTGLPSFQSPSLSVDAAAFNSLYRARTELAGGVFIDIWDGFADENGKFIASGSDINGQPVRLRGSDGLSLTKSGKRKMAFYIEKDMRRLLGGGPLTALAQPGAAGLPLDAAATAPVDTDIQTVAPVSLADPELDGASVLLDSALMPKTSGKSPRDLLIDKGETRDAPSGRVDDFRWTPAIRPAG